MNSREFFYVRDEAYLYEYIAHTNGVSGMVYPTYNSKSDNINKLLLMNNLDREPINIGDDEDIPSEARRCFSFQILHRGVWDEEISFYQKEKYSLIDLCDFAELAKQIDSFCKEKIKDYYKKEDIRLYNFIIEQDE